MEAETWAIDALDDLTPDIAAFLDEEAHPPTGWERLLPYRRLACAVILQALRDLGRGGQAGAEAFLWFFHESNAPALAFWCELANVEIEQARSAAAQRMLARITGWAHPVEQRAR